MKQQEHCHIYFDSVPTNGKIDKEKNIDGERERERGVGRCIVDLKDIAYHVDLYPNLTVCYLPARNIQEPSVGYSTALSKWLFLLMSNKILICKHRTAIPHFLS